MKNSRDCLMRGVMVVLALIISLTPSNGVSQSRGETNSSGKASSASHKDHKDHKAIKPISEFKYQSANNYLPISFETLGAFQIKVDWVMNPTNSAADSVKREGEIPARLKALDGKKISIAGFMKPVRQESGSSTEFLLVPNYFTCCEGQIPGVNELIHVLVPQSPIPLSGERPLALRGVLRVGEKLAGSNVVSIYQLENAELELIGQND